MPVSLQRVQPFPLDPLERGLLPPTWLHAAIMASQAYGSQSNVLRVPLALRSRAWSSSSVEEPVLLSLLH